MMRARLVAALVACLALAVLATSCTSGAPTSDSSAADGASAGEGGGVSAVVASFDLAVGDDQRFMVGLFTDEQELIAGGSIDVEVFPLEQDAESDDAVASGAGQSAEATYLPVPGREPAEPLGDPQVVGGAETLGVYEASVDLTDAGFWGVRVRADMPDLGSVESTASFAVREAHEVPVVGEEAPPTENLTADAAGVPAAAIDSRAEDGEPLPDPSLHATTVADAIEAGRPVVVAVATPVFCVSRFCGPIVDAVADLQDEYGDRADFVHIEVWRDFEAQELNDAAAEWIQTEDGGNEPWVFLVGADGEVAARWDNVLDAGELTEMLEALPPAS